MLTHEDKQRIREEEIYRIEIQRELTKNENPSSRSTQVWQILNSAFALWLLSSIFLTLISWGYAQWQAKNERETKDAETIKKLDLEIASRFEAVDFLRWGLRTIKEDQLPTDLADKLLLPPGSSNVLVSDYANRNLKSLLYELSLAVPENEQEPIEQAIKEVEKIEGRYAGTKMPSDEISTFLEQELRIYKLRWDPLTKLGKRMKKFVNQIEEHDK